MSHLGMLLLGLGLSCLWRAQVRLDRGVGDGADVGSGLGSTSCCPRCCC